MTKTSKTHPIRVDFVDLPMLRAMGGLGLTLAPGKFEPQKWCRDLEWDLDRLRREHHVDTLVTLLAGREIDRLRLPGFFGRVNANGMEAIWMPLSQGKRPESDDVIGEGIAAIVERLKMGKRVVVHCSGGLGRSGLVAACCLIGVGVSPVEAIAAVRSARQGAIEGGQERFVRSFRPSALRGYGGQHRPEVFPVEPHVESVLRALVDERRKPDFHDEAVPCRVVERFLLGEEEPATPLEAIHVLATLRGTYLDGGSALPLLEESKLRGMLGSCLALRSRMSEKDAEGIDRWNLVYGSRSAELVEPLIGYLLECQPTPQPLDEDRILTFAALRFDGYAYADATGFDWMEWTTEHFAAEGDQLEPLEVLALFFASQRYLCKWGGEMLPKTHRDWWMYRELFLRAVETPVPLEYRGDTWWLEWKLRYEPRRDECIEVVAEAHMSTAYEDAPCQN